jgi:predicted transcriptional regulator
LEINSARVQNDVLNRIQDSRGRLEAEIRKLLHEVSRIAEQALDRARKVKEEGTPAVQSAIERLNRFENDVSALVEFRSCASDRRASEPAIDVT